MVEWSRRGLQTQESQTIGSLLIFSLREIKKLGHSEYVLSFHWTLELMRQISHQAYRVQSWYDENENNKSDMKKAADK